MTFLAPNTYVTVTRGFTGNEFGSMVPDPTPVYTHVPVNVATIISNRYIDVTSPESGRTAVVTEVYGTVERGTDVRINDRLHDEYTAVVYEVRAVTEIVANVGYSQLPTHLVLRTVET
jgi:hypothetical protein